MRKLLIVPIILVIAVVAVQASGAFTSVAAERNATIDVAGDDSALLALTPSNGPNGAYFTDSDSNGAYELAVTRAGAGLNVDATIVIDDIFTITNNGTRAVTVTIQKTGDKAARADFGNIESGVALGAGDSVSVGLTLDTHGLVDGDSVLTSITIVAE